MSTDFDANELVNKLAYQAQVTSYGLQSISKHSLDSMQN